MNYDLMIDYLKQWGPDETFYRAYYLAKKSGQTLDNLIRNASLDPAVICFASDPSTIDPNKTERDFFNAGRNVSLVKHPRYLPFFEHKHAFFEMIYILNGHCQEVTRDRSMRLEEGDLCLLAPGVTHGINVDDDSVILNILIRTSTFMDIFLNTVRDKSQVSSFFLGNIYEKNRITYLIFHTHGDTIIRNYILDMYMEQMHLDDYSDRIICSLLTIFLAQLTRLYGRTVEAADSEKKQYPFSDEMLCYIHYHYRDVTLGTLAEHFHFSVPYCSKIIKEISGTSFSDLITRVRLQQAENMLIHTQMSVADISERIGYKNPETFIRAFQRVYSISPSQYRKSV